MIEVIEVKNGYSRNQQSPMQTNLQKHCTLFSCQTSLESQDGFLFKPGDIQSTYLILARRHPAGLESAKLPFIIQQIMYFNQVEGHFFILWCVYPFLPLSVLYISSGTS